MADGHKDPRWATENLPDDPEQLKHIIRLILEDDSRNAQKCEEALNAMKSLLSSWRWRIGNGVMSIAERLLRRKPVRLATDHVIDILSRIVLNNRQRNAFGASAFLLGGGGDLQFFSGKDAKKNYTKKQRGLLQEFLESEERLVFKNADSPKVSILLVLYNRAELTLACLRSILSMVKDDYEVIIVDNDSSDETAQVLDRIDGAVIVKNNQNEGFLLACNAGAKIARGKYLLLLNNDAVLLDDSVNKAVQVFEQGDKIGAVGGKILLLDGSLQEAGSIVWNDGSCLGYGRCDSPEKPQYMFQRNVDYCSGAFLMVPLALFDQLGGFDTVFVPAYYEETDFCLRLNENGYKVVYEPSINILHYEFGSSQGDDATDLQKRNRKAFVANHPEYLAQKLKPAEANILKARFADSNIKKVLYIDDRVPHSHFGSGFPRSNFILNTLVELGYQVTLYPLNFPNEDNWNTVYGDVPNTVEAMLHLGRKQLGEHLKKRLSYYDLIFVSRPHNMEFFTQTASKVYGRGTWPKVIYDAEAIFSLRDAAKYEVFSGKKDKELEKNINEEVKLVDKSDLVITVSPEERKTFAKYYRGEIHVIGHAIEINPTKLPFNERHDLLFIGNLDYNSSPNVDSIVWFVNEVFPLLHDKLPGINLKLVGSNESSEIQKLGKRRQVELLGRQESLEPFYNLAKVFIAPTRFAGGVPYKIHEAASFGVPVVASELLCEQLGWKEGEELLVADVRDPEDFANNCVRLYTDQNLWESVRKAALKRVEGECSVSTIKKRVEAAFDSV